MKTETMTGGSQVHIFWGAPVLPLKTTVSQEPTSSIPAADPWKKVQLLYNQHSLHLKDEKCKHKNLENYQVLDSIGPPGLNSLCLLNSRKSSVPLKDDFICCISETQNIKSQKSSPSGMSGVTDSSMQICGLKSRVQHLTGKEKYQKLVTENKKITDEQHKDQSNICVPDLTKTTSQLDPKCAALLDLVCSTKQINIGPEPVETTYVPRAHHETQSQRVEFLPSKTVDKPRPEEAVTKASNLNVSTDTEFLSVMTSSQVAFLAQRKYKGQNSLNKGTVNMKVGPKASHEEIRVIEDNLIHRSDDFAEGFKSGQSQAYSLELFSPVGPETKSSHIVIDSETDLEENIGSQELFSPDVKLPPNEICIESCSSGILCSQLNTFHKSSVKRSWISEHKAGHSKAPSKTSQVSKKSKLLSNAGDLAVTLDQRNVSEFKYIKKTSLIKNCDCKSQKYNCLVVVLSPCHVKEVNIKSGPHSGSTVPLAALEVIDQTEIKKKVFMWRTAAFWALTVFPGDIILLTDVTIHENQWVGETVLQSTFTSQLLNLGSYSSVRPEEYSSIVSAVVLQDLLAYVSSKHPCLRDLPQRQPQKVKRIEFVELKHLQPEILVHAVLRVVDITILTEALYNYRGQKQRKVVLTVEQTQGQHYVLVLWGAGAAWYPQIQRKKGVVLIKAQILELVFPIIVAQKRQITLNAHSSLKSIFSSLPNIIYTGCAKCGLELETDDNKIFKQCFSCLPSAMKKIYYRPALMTVVGGGHNVSIQVGSELIEKILLNIPADWLNRVIVPPSGITYGMVAADLLHAFLALNGAPCLLKIQSLFVLDENSYPLQQDFCLLDFYLDNVKHGPTP
ncbi:shieldin complex subunit 2 isoform X4 [Loxodonta africana]|uniref:shieldin complex subunit 2 isoform X4 n=1 Tax=Loxodonta africana TaxID=9785 RepID=UPI000C811F45|nr:protein FAM35A isoform X3 [Loxodonta africana]